MSWKSSLVAEVRRCEGSGVRRNVVQPMSPCDVFRPSWPLLRCHALIALAGAYPLLSSGATHVVTTLADNGLGSLRQAIADALPGDTIVFATNGTIRLTSGELFLDKSLDLVGPGAAQLAVSGNFVSRVFNISAGVTCSISGLTIRDGRTADGTNGLPGASPGSAGASGGGLLNLGTLTLDACSVTANLTGRGGNGGRGANGTNDPLWGRSGGTGGSGGAGGAGGGMYNAGTLTLSNCVFSGNSTGNGGDGGYGGYGGTAAPISGHGGPGGNGGAGGLGGSGAGIHNAGILILRGCVFTGNTTGNGGLGGFGNLGGYGELGGRGGNGGGGGLGGHGAAFRNDGTAALNASTFDSNSTGFGAAGGGAGLGGLQGGEIGRAPSGDPGTNGGGGSGGAVWSEQGTLTVSACSFVGNFNRTGGNGGGIGNKGTLDVSGSVFTGNSCSTNGNGGAVFNQGSLTVSACTFSNNSCLYYGSGGGLFTLGTGTVLACTFNGNRAGSPYSQYGGGGGIANGGALTLSNSTVSSNSAYYGGGISSSGRLTVVSCTIVSNYAGAFGGGIHNTAYYTGDVASVRNSLIARNRGQFGNSFYRDFGSLGHNLVGDGSFGFTNTAPGDIIGGDPLLGPLADNGGPTWTHALLPGSPALDTGDDALSGTDQRGRPRRAGAHVDIGAFEYGPATPQLLTGLRRQPNGAFQFAFTNLTDATFNVLATTNVALPAAQWDNLGPATRLADTLYQFTDPAATINWRRFYQLRWP
jgi:fibronectin-binding autotransporter adhesin